MTKQEEFLWGVQTLILLDSHNLCLDLDVEKDRHKISATGRVETMIYALKASRSIPENMSAEEAAHSFFFWDKGRYSGESKPAPHWILSSDLHFDFRG